LRFFGEVRRRNTTMRKSISISIVSMSLVAASLMIPSGRGFADENPPGNHKQREELRRDQQQLERFKTATGSRAPPRAISAKPGNTMIRYATKRGKVVKTEELFTDRTVTEGIMTGITIMTDFLT